MPRCLIVVLLVGLNPGLERVAAQEAKPAGGPEGALAAYKAAIESGDIKAVAELTAGPSGDALRKLAGPLTRAKAASDKLDKVLRDRPEIGYKNSFAPGLSPFADMQYEVIEVEKEGDKVVARIKYGPRGKAQEETVQVQTEAGKWRVDAPAELVKHLRKLSAPGQLERHAQGLDRLADLLDTLATEIENGTLKTKEQVLLRTLDLFAKNKLAELLK
jgi:hypothetical protein